MRRGKDSLRNKERECTHHDPELTVAYLPIPILVHSVDHLIYLSTADLGRIFLIQTEWFLTLTEHSHFLGDSAAQTEVPRQEYIPPHLFQTL